MGRFEEIVGHGDYETAKPAPDPFLKAAERLGVEPRSGIIPSSCWIEAVACESR
jgi:beta-phosphoglucomutase-like phosphatase (HAD superfamily)